MFAIFNNKIISQKEKNILLEWIYKNENKFIQNPNGQHRKYYKFSYDNRVPKLFFEIKSRIIKRENIKVWCIEPVYADYIGIISDGGFIHEHTDENYKNLNHVRYNLFLSVPKKGGYPIYNGKKITSKGMLLFKMQLRKRITFMRSCLWR